MKELAKEFDILYRSPDPKKDFPFSPAILVLKNGRYLASIDVADKYGKIYTSDDKGKTWNLKAEEGYWHASPFLDGDRIYLLGCSSIRRSDLIIMYSDDNGDTWSKAFFLTEGENWCHAATDVWYKDGYVYVPMDQQIINEGEVIRSGWKPCIIAPVILRGKLGSDLTKRENWLFSDKVRCIDAIPEKDIDYFGVPFFPSLEDSTNGEIITASPAKYRRAYNHETDTPGMGFRFHALGWLETNVVQITDPKHYWYDPSGKTLHLFMRANTHGTGYCAMMKAVEKVVDGKEVINIEFETNPSGKKIVLLPMPGGQNKFFVKYDKKTKLYWLVSVQATDSMTRIEFLSEDRYNVPSDERDRLALHFSKNMVDWCFAGLIDQSGFENQSRHYASMDIDGEDLVILSRSGDKDAHSAHDGNIITLHRVKNFRDLVY
ncbi:MAG: exo-alpha-sialidase [Clostridia bacterium]|nr:exo-alpha-sialidase [Clostridia bacterium]